MENNSQKQILYGNVYLKTNGLYRKDEEDGEEYWVGERLGIKNMFRNLDTGKVSANVHFISFGKELEQELPRECYLTKSSIQNLQSLGMDVNQLNYNWVLKHMINQERQANIINTHSKLGFANHDNKLVYKLDTCVGIKSSYTGNINVKTKGSKEVWLNMLSKEVIGNERLELIVTIGLSAILVGFIGDRYNMDTLLVHLVGNSTTGKSTATKLAISAYGTPHLNENGLYSTYNATENALLKRVANTKGILFGIDELSINKMHKTTGFIYALSSGKGKDRLNKNSEIKPIDTWQGAVISNGEKSLIRSANQNAGVQIRVIEIDGVMWTSSAENAEVIDKVISNNYGHIAIEFAEFIMKLGEDRVSQIYQNSVELVKSVLDNQNATDTFTNRRANKLGLIIATARIFESYLKKQTQLKTKLDIKGMMNILIDVEKESIKSRNFDKSVIDHIVQYITFNKNKFERKGKEQPKGEVLGKFINKDNHIELSMTEVKFEEMIKEGGYEDKNVVLKELKAKGMLSCDKDRYTRIRKNDDGILTKFIVLKLHRKNK